MLKRPTTRRKSKKEPVPLNLVPMLDALVTLIAFLMASASFLAIVQIESPVPITNRQIFEDTLDKKPLQLTLSITKDYSEIWSPFNRIKKVKLPSDEAGIPDLVGIHDELVNIKSRFPNETKIVFLPDSDISYDTLIAVMDVAKMLEKSDPPLFRKNLKTGLDEEVTRLFPEIIFGNLLGG